jgi:putative ABC transport system permease protein
MDQLLTVIQLAGVFSLVTIAAMLTFRFAGFPDLSVDGVFALGSVAFIKSAMIGLPFVLSLTLAMMAGVIAGSITSIISTKLKINPLLASVLILTILYSLNLRILGAANVPMVDNGRNNGFDNDYFTVLVVGISVFVVIVSVFFFKSELGAALRCSGSSPSFLSSVGKNVSFYRIVLVALGSGSIAMAGALLSYRYGFADVTIGSGTVIIGIASLIIGEKLLGRETLVKQILAVPTGIFVYEAVVALALSLGVSPIDVKLATGIITIILLTTGRNESDWLFAQSS